MILTPIKDIETFQAGLVSGAKMIIMKEIGKGTSLAEIMYNEIYMMEEEEEAKEESYQKEEADSEEKEEPAVEDLPAPEEPKKEKPKSKLDKGKVLALYKAGWTQQDIAKEMGVSQGTISNCIKSASENVGGAI